MGRHALTGRDEVGHGCGELDDALGVGEVLVNALYAGFQRLRPGESAREGSAGLGPREDSDGEVAPPAAALVLSPKSRPASAFPQHAVRRLSSQARLWRGSAAASALRGHS